MGRLPLRFAGKDVTFRVPTQMSAEIDVAANQHGELFPAGSFLSNNDKPTELHRMKVRLVALGTVDSVDNVVLEPQPTTLGERVRLHIENDGITEKLTKNPTYVSLIPEDNTGWWNWEEPMTMVKTEELTVQVDTDDLPSVCIVDPNSGDCTAYINTPVTAVRVMINFQGFTIVVAPPSENR